MVHWTAKSRHVTFCDWTPTVREQYIRTSQLKSLYHPLLLLCKLHRQHLFDLTHVANLIKIYLAMCTSI